MRKFPGLILKVFFPFFVLAASSALGQENLPVLIKKVESSIVMIVTYSKEGNMLGQGSGFFIDKEGDVITNSHVLQEAGRAAIRTTDGKEYPVKKILAEDKEGDLIQVSVDISKEAVRPLPVSTRLPEVGERVIVIGTPLGLDKTVSDGIVSALREIPGFGKIVQVTAPISPGSSGSPVINMKGEVIGIATFFVVAGQNLNFAIPGERIARLTMGQGETLSEREEGRIKDWLASAEGLYATGLRFLWAEDYEKALPYFVETVKRNPGHAAGYFQMGYCLARLGQFEEAIGPYQQAIRINPKDADFHNNLCVAYGMVGRYDNAIESCRQSIQLKSDLAESHNNLGWSYQRLGRYQEAIQSCKEAIRLKPDFAPAHYNLGNSYAALKKYGEAIDSYKEAIRIKFDYAEGHLDLGAAYFHTGRIEEAIVSYKQAIRLKPSLAEAHLNLGMSYLRLGDKGSAIEEYKTLKELDKELANRLFNLIYE
jgi:tetratricopeptide (TPR) repeat protein